MDLTRFFTNGIDTALALSASYEPLLVVASYVIAALAGFTFLRFASRIGELGGSILRFVWMAAGSVIMGLGVWAMHFVGMLAYNLPIAVNYDPIITTLSVFPAMVGSAIALHVVARPSVTMPRLAAGAVALGGGIGAMHYTGMAALHFDAFIRYDPVLFATSVVVAVVLAFIALFTTLWSLKTKDEHLITTREGAGALVLGLAVSGMHYTAMTSAYCFSDAALHDASGIETNVFAAMTVIVAVLVLLLTIAGTMFDRRLRAEITRREHVQTQLLQAQKMEALGNLAGGIAHEFNNALLPIVALTELTLDDLPNDSDGRENLSTVLEAARHAKYLVNQVMVFSRQNERPLSKVDLSAAVSDGIRLLREELPAEIEITHRIDPGIGMAMADREQIASLIMHLGSNAADAMPDGTGEIHIQLANADVSQDAADIGAALDAKRRYACLSVRDNGHGMDAQTLSKIFNPFFTTKPVGEGTGLGLAMAHGIIQRFDGTVDVTSEPGVGTTFRIYLPLLSETARDFAEAA